MTGAAEVLADLHRQPDLSAGLCVGDAESFTDAVEDPGLADACIAACLRCPVYQACADWAASLPEGHVHGVVGGTVREWLSPSERWRRRRAA
ncbi:WhiB family transcriptional regulator [Mycobacterium scrofulaceum]|uniref:4Fe-4S Wbl-type domain-containing protein n=1 Tax=Mycobacterium scrofulaceum TaxID=1783 RepID=A0A1X0KLK2_MYCSC|nr:hypothetical protein BST44_02735 [Mycobacterium scrofulaceum]